MKFIKFVAQFFQDKGISSSKRLAGLVCTGFLCHKLWQGTPADSTIVMSVTTLALGCLGLTTAEKIFTKKPAETNPPQ